MPSNRGLWLLLLGLVAGILIGYFLLPHNQPVPPAHTNTVAFNILPGGVQVAPNAGDKVEWRRDGKVANYNELWERDAKAAAFGTTAQN